MADNKTFQDWKRAGDLKGSEASGSSGGEDASHSKGSPNTPNQEPSWRKAQDSKPKDLPTSPASAVQLVTLVLASVMIIVGGYFVWYGYLGVSGSNVYGTQVGSDKDADTDTSKDTDDSDTGTDLESKSEEITYHMVEVGAVGTRDIVTGEMEIGCGDILVPITILHEFGVGDLEKNGSVNDITKLKVALNTLLSFKETVYDEAEGLVTGLATSTLSVDSVSKTSSKYIVNLTGIMRSQGVCETERIYKQLEETSRINVDGLDVEFRLNGSAKDYEVFGDLSGDED